VALGEAAWTVVLGDRVDPALHERVTALAAAIEAARLPGVREIVPAFAAVTVFFDPAAADADALREQLARLAMKQTFRPSALPPSRLLSIPVTYDGPDLDEVASRTGLSRDEVIRRHTAPEYRVYLLGFAPGFAYLGDLDPSLVLPRKAAPRTRVPAGSVAIAGAQTGVYPLATPGGWHLIGTTPLAMFDPAREPAVLLRVGDRVRFEKIS
jgi:KipI family sensor histidine kinase inhibitor